MNYCIHCMEPLQGGEATCPNCGKPQAYNCQEHQLHPGTLLGGGRYLLGVVLGDGGFGITYIARDLRLDRVVAIKEFFPLDFVMRSCKYSKDITVLTHKKGLFEDSKRKFLDEAKILASMENEPGIVDVIDYFEENNTAYIVMRVLRGETLEEYIKQVRWLSFEKAYQMLRPVMQSLKAAHEKNIIHRDIAPDNIMITDRGAVLFDFGIAKNLSLQNTHSQAFVKKGFSPYEQYTKGNQGPWTDVYALCATLYYCVMGRKPQDACERAKKLKTPLRLKNARFSPEVQKVLAKGMEIFPEKRYQSVGELMQALDKAVNREKRKKRTKRTKRVWKGNPQLLEAVNESKKESERDEGKKKYLVIKIIAAVLVLALLGRGIQWVVEKYEGRNAEKEKTQTTSTAAEVTPSGTAADTNVSTATTTDDNTSEFETIFFGAYEQDNNTYNGKEDIEWLVLKKDGNRALLISKYALDSQPYNEEAEDVTWETCTLRTWLNGTFFEEAFSTLEQKRILTTNVTADKNPEWSTDPGNDTQDKVFLLSIDEGNQYFSSDKERKCTPTDFATTSQGAIASSSFTSQNSESNCTWWLRSLGETSHDVAWVGMDGVIIEAGASVDSFLDAVRPAMWIDFSNSTEISAADAGDYITLGAYEQDNNAANGKEPIEWLVLKKDGNKVLVISKYGLDCQPYNTECHPYDQEWPGVTWETCTLRAWLNDTFYYDAFNIPEQSKILTTTVEADINEDDDEIGSGTDTTDKVFLLSDAEMYDFNYDTNKLNRGLTVLNCCAPTVYAFAQSQGKERLLPDEFTAKDCAWWLRTTYGNSSYGYYCKKDSAFFYSYNSPLTFVDSIYAVRPAMWIKLD